MMTMNPPINSLLSPNPNPPIPFTVAFTTPENYAGRLSLLLHRRNWTPLWCPTVVVEPTSATNTALLIHFSSLDSFSAVAFTSRAGISAFSSAASAVSPPLSPSGDHFILCALGNDAELLTPDFVSKLCPNSERVKLVVPPNSTPSGLVESLGPGLGRKVLCPVPLVVGLEEPPVVPQFLHDLGLMGWAPVRVNAYATRWAGPNCALRLVEGDDINVEAMIFTSTAEVEGLLKGLREFGLGWEDVRKRWPGLVVAAHGPVTASGAERLGVRVDVVSSKFSSFDGVVEALDHTFREYMI